MTTVVYALAIYGAISLAACTGGALWIAVIEVNDRRARKQLDRRRVVQMRRMR